MLIYLVVINHICITLKRYLVDPDYFFNPYTTGPSAGFTSSMVKFTKISINLGEKTIETHTIKRNQKK
jgi:UDP-galactopyranose mutase